MGLGVCEGQSVQVGEGHELRHASVIGHWQCLEGGRGGRGLDVVGRCRVKKGREKVARVTYYSFILQA